MPPQPGETVIWIKVAKPTLDLVGVVLSAFGITGVLVVLALLLGLALGLSLILKRRREAQTSVERVSLSPRAPIHRVPSHRAPGGGPVLDSPR